MSALHKPIRSSTMNMTEGNILRLLIRFSLPLLAGDLFQQLYNTVDTWVVGNYVGSTAFSAVGTMTPIINILIGLFMGFSVGASVVASQHFGAGDEEQVSQSVHTSMLITVLLGIVLTAAGVLMTPAMLRLIKVPADVYPEAFLYLRIYFTGLLGQLVYNMGSAILRSVGDSRRPFYFLAFCTLLNTVLDLLFVIVFHMGVAGVAWATVIAQFVSALLVVVVLMRETGCIRLELRRLSIRRHLLRRIVQIGVPNALQNSVTSFANVFTLSYINYFGSVVMGGYTALNKLDAFIGLPAKSIALAVTTFVAQNVGRGELRRAVKGLKTAVLSSFVITALIIVCLNLWAEPIVRFFIDDDEVVAYGVYFLRFIPLFHIFICLTQVLPAGLRGAGDARAPMIISLSSFVLFRQIYLYVMSRYICNEVLPIVMSFPAGWLMCALLMVLYYRKHPIDKSVEKHLELS